MDRIEAIKKLNNILDKTRYEDIGGIYYCGTEMGHIEGDNILCDLLISLGYEDVVALYKKIGKYYI